MGLVYSIVSRSQRFLLFFWYALYQPIATKVIKFFISFAQRSKYLIKSLVNEQNPPYIHSMATPSSSYIIPKWVPFHRTPPSCGRIQEPAFSHLPMYMEVSSTGWVYVHRSP